MLIEKKYDCIIVGAGPAGMFCALELANKTKMKILVVDKGKDVIHRKNNGMDILEGVGGAGCKSDGKLNLSPFIGGNLLDFCDSEEQAQKMINNVDEVFMSYGAPKNTSLNPKDISDLQKRAIQCGIKYIPIIQKHIGSDKLPDIVIKFKKALVDKGVDFLLEKTVKDIIVEEKNNKKIVDGVIIGNEGDDALIFSDFVVLAPGRSGQRTMTEIAQKHSIEKQFSYIDIGVRVETNKNIMEDITSINYDPKLHILTKTYGDFARTFCTNPSGFVVKETYDGYIGVNGHSKKHDKSQNTNFALLINVLLTEPLENANNYGENIAKLATTTGGGKITLQRLGDLLNGRRTRREYIQNNMVIPTLKEYTAGDISMILPGRIMTDIVDALKQLNELIPGIYADSTLLYAPEIKYYSVKINVDRKTLQTNIDNLFVAGDGAGLSRDIINASVTGILAADGVISKNK
ncbi:MAG: FAD-dependent oxidoreductase [Candidatus Nanohalarchaeota archaeon]|nr:MAG: FAD-dependent oxidoreductase [Candidatus Nanohaloarchaeota archaeon]